MQPQVAPWYPGPYQAYNMYGVISESSTSFVDFEQIGRQAAKDVVEQHSWTSYFRKYNIPTGADSISSFAAAMGEINGKEKLSATASPDVSLVLVSKAAVAKESSDEGLPFLTPTVSQISSFDDYLSVKSVGSYFPEFKSNVIGVPYVPFVISSVATIVPGEDTLVKPTRRSLHDVRVLKLVEQQTETDEPLLEVNIPNSNLFLSTTPTAIIPEEHSIIIENVVRDNVSSEGTEDDSTEDDSSSTDSEELSVPTVRDLVHQNVEPHTSKYGEYNLRTEIREINRSPARERQKNGKKPVRVPLASLLRKHGFETSDEKKKKVESSKRVQYKLPIQRNDPRYKANIAAQQAKKEEMRMKLPYMKRKMEAQARAEEERKNEKILKRRLISQDSYQSNIVEAFFSKTRSEREKHSTVRIDPKHKEAKEKRMEERSRERSRDKKREIRDPRKWQKNKTKRSVSETDSIAASTLIKIVDYASSMMKAAGSHSDTALRNPNISVSDPRLKKLLTKFVNINEDEGRPLIPDKNEDGTPKLRPRIEVMNPEDRAAHERLKHAAKRKSPMRKSNDKDVTSRVENVSEVDNNQTLVVTNGEHHSTTVKKLKPMLKVPKEAPGNSKGPNMQLHEKVSEERLREFKQKYVGSEYSSPTQLSDSDYAIPNNDADAYFPQEVKAVDSLDLDQYFIKTSGKSMFSYTLAKSDIFKSLVAFTYTFMIFICRTIATR